LTNQELADRIGLSASQCSRRRAALEDSGVIESYRAILSQERLGVDLTAFVQISLNAHSPDIAQSLFRLLEETAEIQEAYSLTGDADYLVKLAVPDLKALSHILNAVLLPHESVARIRSSIVLNRLKQKTQLPLGHLK
jgi:DNA-binding Lrp family transcriptional regulator